MNKRLLWFLIPGMLVATALVSSHLLYPRILEARLWEAVEKSNVDEVKSLLARGVSPNLRNDEGRTLLRFAIAFSHGDVARSLLRSGASVAGPDSELRSLVDDADQFAAPDIEFAIYDRIIPSEQKDRLGRSGLIKSCAATDVSTASKFLARGVDPNARKGRKDGLRFVAAPLHVAIERGSLELVGLLLAHNVDVNQMDTLGTTALMKAAGLGRDDIVAELLQRSPNMPIRNRNGLTALGMALFRPVENDEVITQLEKAGCPL